MLGNLEVNIFQLLTIAWQGLLSNKLRTGLTVLGIIIGIGSVIALLGIGEGAKAEAEKQVTALGVNLIYIRPGSTTTSGLSQGQGTAHSLTYDDALAIKENCPAVENVAAQYPSNFQVQFNEENTNTSVVATEPSYPNIRNFFTKRGRFFNEAELKEAARVAVIGDTITDVLFDNDNPIGKRILIRGEIFTVIGEMEHKGVAQGMDMDDQVFIPITTGYSTLHGLSQVTGRSVRAILVQAHKDQDLQANFQITNLLRLRHNLHNEEDDFTLRTQLDIMQTAQSITGVFSLLLGATAGISLLVGGIGIMNIMLVSVTERTREIGIRKAIGAKYGDILAQFVLEALLMSLTGGVLGIALGVVGSYSISTFAKWTTVITPLSVVLSFCVSVAIGLFFGIYPARKAAKLDPIVALRSD